ncbi:MAG TPA: LysR family transcriptional regulator [Hyphomicrobiaceae bacterium]|nr:LysR family transcriptional regulator [Hyphomicrobiaceae bacterium]
MDIRQSDLGLLLALDALLLERNVTRASERLNISQPAMSAQLARLRDLFGDPLLVSSGRKMVPTARALSLQEPLNQILRELAQLIREREPFDPEETSRVFRIMATDYLHMVVTLPLIREVSKITANVQIVLLPFERKTAWPMLENLQADLLIVWKQLTPDEARATPIFVDRLCFVQRKKHPRGKKKPSVDELCQLSHAMIAPEVGTLWGVVDGELEKLGKKRRIVASLPTFLSVPALIAQSDLVAAIPHRLAILKSDELDIFDLPFPNMDFEMLLSWHPRMHADPGHQWLRKLTAASFVQR